MGAVDVVAAPPHPTSPDDQSLFLLALSLSQNKLDKHPNIERQSQPYCSMEFFSAIRKISVTFSSPRRMKKKHRNLISNTVVST
jgi:hypothetical protein